MTITSNLIKRCQSRLKKKNISESSSTIRGWLEALEYDESKDSVEYFWEQMQILIDSSEQKTKLEEVSGSEGTENIQWLNSSEKETKLEENIQEEISFDSSEILEEVVLHHKLNLSQDELKQILSKIKNTFDSQEEAINQIMEVVKEFLVARSEKNGKLIEDVENISKESFIPLNNRTKEVVNNLAILKQENESLLSHANYFSTKYKESIRMRDRLVGCIFLLAITLLGVIPFTLNFDKASSLNYIEKQCNQQNSKKLAMCNKINKK